MDDISHLTILHPRESSFANSSRITAETATSTLQLDREQWKGRKEFFFTTLAFCLSLANFWRFPKQALLHGHASFVWLYIVLSFVVGCSLLFFEVALGQYSNRGFAKVFAMCPIFEGISYSMAFYCAAVSTLYNMLNVYSFIYLFASFNKTVTYVHCNVPAEFCEYGLPNHTTTPEYNYFEHSVVQHSADERHINFNATAINWRNVGVLFFLWILITIAIIRGIRTVGWPSKLYCPLPFIVLIVTFLITMRLEGTWNGLKAMFVPTMEGFKNAETWKYALEQSLVALGLGMGPLITFGSHSKFQSSAHLDCFILCVFTMIGSILIGTVFFGGLGALAHERNETMDTVLTQNGQYPLDLNVHVIYSQIFSRLPYGASQFVSFIFFLMFLISGWFSLIGYTETFIVMLYTILPYSYKCKLQINVAVCVGCFMVGSALASRAGHKYLMTLDAYFIGTSLIFIVLCEMIAVIYIYGVFEFCDDIEFMLSTYPGIYYQYTWITCPLLLAVTMLYSGYLFVQRKFNIYSIITMALLATFIILPVVFCMLYRFCRAWKLGNVKSAILPREVILLEPDGQSSVNSSSQGSSAAPSLKSNKLTRTATVFDIHAASTSSKRHH